MDINHFATRIAQSRPHLKQLEIAEPTLLASGWESDIFEIGYTAHDANLGQQVHDSVIARIYFGEGAAGKAAHEFVVMSALARAGYPSPQPLWMEEKNPVWQRPVLFMNRAPGAPIWDSMLRGDATTRAGLRRAFVRAFVALHQLDIQATDLAKTLPIPAARDAVAGQVETLRRFSLALPDIGFGPALDVLAAQAGQVRPGRVGLAHWDFHPANVLADLTGGGQAEADLKLNVIDWSGAGVTDTRFDLAWTLVVVGSQAGWEAADPILEDYEAQGGPQVDLDFFLRLAYARRLYVMTLALLHGAGVLGLRADAEAAIRDRLDGMRMIYARWVASTGAPISTVEQILER